MRATFVDFILLFIISQMENDLGDEEDEQIFLNRNQNLMKLIVFYQEGIMKALVKFFHRDETRFPSKNPQLLNKNLKNEFRRKNISKKKFNCDQLKVLFPSDNKTHSKNFDATVTTRLILLLDICGDETEKLLIQQVREWRNTILHATEIDDDHFDTLWEEGKEILRKFNFKFDDSTLRNSSLSLDTSKIQEVMHNTRGIKIQLLHWPGLLTRSN